MYKIAQFNNADDLTVDLPENDDEQVVFYTDLPTTEEVVEMHEPIEKEVSFALPFLPGAEDLPEISGEDLEVSEDEDSDKDKDKEKNEVSPKEFVNWMQSYLEKIPKHKGETVGLERALSYLKRGMGMLSKILQQDFDGEIDISKAEDARIEMENGIDRLEKELHKRRKKASVEDNSLTKEAQKLPAVGGIIVTVPILISRIARVCINGTIYGGKSIEDLFHRQAEKYKLTDREKVEVIQLITDMGYPVSQLDRGFLVDDKEEYKRPSTNNYDYPANYSS